MTLTKISLQQDDMNVIEQKWLFSNQKGRYFPENSRVNMILRHFFSSIGILKFDWNRLKLLLIFSVFMMFWYVWNTFRRFSEVRLKFFPIEDWSLYSRGCSDWWLTDKCSNWTLMDQIRGNHHPAAWMMMKHLIFRRPWWRWLDRRMGYSSVSHQSVK